MVGSATLVTAALLPTQAAVAGAPAEKPARDTLVALLGIVAASPELGKPTDLRAARRRLMEFYAADPGGSSSAAIVVSVLDSATRPHPFASASRKEQLRALKEVLARPPSTDPTGAPPAREHVVSALHRAQAALSEEPRRLPRPRLTIADGVVI